MGIFDKLKKVLKSPPEPKTVKETVKLPPKKSEKQIATEKGESYVNILSMDLDPGNLNMVVLN